jgi:hypothetical protein
MVHTDTVQVWHKDNKDLEFLFSVEAIKNPDGIYMIVLDNTQLATVQEVIETHLQAFEEDTKERLIEVTRPLEPKIPSVKPLKKRWDLTDEN